MKRFLLLLAALLACGVIAAGCGDDDSDSADDDSPATTDVMPADTSDSESDDSASDDSAVPGNGAAVEQALENCRKAVQASGGQLEQDTIDSLKQICENAATGDEDDVRKASLEICKKVIEDSVPEGPARDQALDACEKSVPQP
jgi:hypothetical protein